MSEGSVEEDGNGLQPEHSSTDEPSTPRVLVILALVLERLVTRNDQLESGYQLQLRNEETAAAAQGKNLKVFHGVRAPNISIPKYLERIYKYSNCSPSCFVVGFIYIDRLIHRYPELLVVSLNVHRLLVTSVMVASKMLDDEKITEWVSLVLLTGLELEIHGRHYNNEFYAKVGGVSIAELNRLEVELLFLLDFEVVVSSSVFETYCFHLETEMMRITIQKPLKFDLVDDLNDSIAEEDAT